MFCRQYGGRYGGRDYQNADRDQDRAYRSEGRDRRQSGDNDSRPPRGGGSQRGRPQRGGSRPQRGSGRPQQFSKRGGNRVPLTPSGESLQVLSETAWMGVQVASPPIDAKPAVLAMETEAATAEVEDATAEQARLEAGAESDSDALKLAHADPQLAWFHYSDMGAGARQALTAHDYNKFMANLKRGRGNERLSRMQAVLKDAQDAGLAEVSAYNSILHVMVREDNVNDARELMRNMQKRGVAPSIVTYNIILFGLARARRAREALGLFEELRSAPGDLGPDVYTYATIIGMHCVRGNMDDAASTIVDMQISGIPVNAYIEELMLRGYAGKNRIKDAHTVLGALEKRAIQDAKAVKEGTLGPDTKPYQLRADIYNTLLAIECKRHENSPYLNSLYKRMLNNGVRPTPATYAALKMQPDEGFRMMREANLVPTTVDLNALLNAAVKKNDFVGAARLVRAASEEPQVPLDVASYAILIDAQVKANDIEAAFGLLNDMREDGIQPDTVIYTSLLDMCARVGDYERAHSIFKGMKTGADINTRPNLITYNIILGMLQKHGDGSQVQKLLDEMPSYNVMPDRRSYNTLIAAYAGQSDWEGVWNAYTQMREAGFHGDLHTFQTMVSSEQQDAERVAQVFADAQKSPLTRGTPLLSSLAAQLMQLHQDNGQADKALEVWRALRYQQVAPNQHCIVMVMRACMQLGLFETADTIWNQLLEAKLPVQTNARLAYCGLLLAGQRWNDIRQQFKDMEHAPRESNMNSFFDQLSSVGQGELAGELDDMMMQRFPSSAWNRTSSMD
ncbi:hypothetical protein THASP1DRAFT_27416 [Thamnocephalis sphaerospora]|uniref:Pentacotripeptide-repeat region of PRORP domain-containing protein n=1 Tax=Thamnocephalis sphaerospora TaxID=78915 RepID=A0A4P9XZC0_9FUNG|nr:hypothetical protein THASP1DRAFT_27416 [Thamnocephalis sphaerospora]|eukprot:RKP10820.1 hypothetical protein THASP1DRAFT_27416 [Thamnocephalis sphaerospora]